MAGCNGLTYANPLAGSIVFADGFQQYYHTIVTSGGQTLLDVSAFGGTGYHVFIPGLKNLSGSATGYLSTNQAANPWGPDAFACGQLTIHYDVGCSISFLALVGQSTITQNYDGKVEITTTWAYSDTATPTILWNES